MNLLGGNMKNLYEKLPTVKDYEKAFGGKALQSWVTTGLNLDNEEDLFKLFVRVQRYAQLKEDPRPPFYAWVKQQHAAIPTGKEYLEFFSGVELNEGHDLEYFEGIVGTSIYPVGLLLAFKSVYNKAYPEGLVKWTPIGKLVKGLVAEIDSTGDEFEELIIRCVESATLELCNCYKTAVETKDNPNPNDINWDSLIDTLSEVDSLSSFHRQHYCSNIMSEIANPFRERQQMMYTDFIFEFVPFILMQHYNVSLRIGTSMKQTPHNPENLFLSHISQITQHCEFEGYTVDKLEVYQDFVSMFGVLVDDFTDLYQEAPLELFKGVV